MGGERWSWSATLQQSLAPTLKKKTNCILKTLTSWFRCVWLGLELNSGRFSICVLVCTCGLVKCRQSLPKYCSNSKFTSSQVQLKYADAFLLCPFYRGCIKRWLVRTWGSQVSQNAFCSKSASINGGGENMQMFKILLLLCHEMQFNLSISGENVVV